MNVQEMGVAGVAFLEHEVIKRDARITELEKRFNFSRKVINRAFHKYSENWGNSTPLMDREHFVNAINFLFQEGER